MQETVSWDKSRRLSNPELIWQLMNDDFSNQPERAVRHAADVSFVNQDVFAVADSEGHRVILFDINRNVCSVIGNEMIWPNSVAVTRDEKIVLTDRRDKTVKIYDVRGDLLFAWGDEDLLLTPHGVAVNSKGEIIVTDTGNNSVIVLTIRGNIRTQFGFKGMDVSNLALPFYCTVDHRDQIIVSDNMNYSIKYFDHQGNFLRKIGSGQDWGHRQFKCPYGVCVDGEDNLLVADNNSDKIFLYGPDGTFLKYLQTKADCRSPCGVSVGRCGRFVYTEAAPEHSNVKAYNYLIQETVV